jgi:hypothetical protein
MSDRHLSSLMKEAACKIGLAPLPLVGGNELYGPSDLEVWLLICFLLAFDGFVKGSFGN